MENLIAALASDRSAAVLALLLGNVAQATALVVTWRWHRQDREADRTRWIGELERHNEALEKLTEALRALRDLILQCPAGPGARSNHGRR
jgi:hypothetical protein